MEDRKSLIRWIKDHKKQMIIAGISIGTLILIILGIKNRAAIKAVWDSLKESCNSHSESGRRSCKGRNGHSPSTRFGDCHCRGI